MPRIGQSNIDIFVRTKADNKGLDNSRKRVNKFSGAVKKLASGLAVGLGIGGVLAVNKLVSSIKKFTTESIQKFQVQEDSEARLLQGLKNLDDEYQVNFDRLTDQASALQKVTRFGDEQIISAQGMLSTFKLSGPAIEAITPSLLNMAEGMRKTTGETVDLNDISIQIGKVMGNAEGGIEGLTSSLSRMGVIMTEEQENILKTGDEMERAAAITSIMDENFGGFAEAGGKTFAGRMDQIKNAFGDLQEIVGKFISEALTKLFDFVGQHIVPVLQRFWSWIKRVWDITKPYRDFIVQQFVTAWEELKVAIEPHKDLLKRLGIVVLALLGGPLASILVVLGLMAASFFAVVLTIMKVVTWLSNLLTKAREMSQAFAISLVEPAVKVVRAFQGIRDAIVGAVAAARAFIDNTPALSGIASVVGKLTGRQHGGPVQAGRAFLVGEAGPEIFVPKTSGNIVPNDEIGSASGITVNQTNNIIRETDMIAVMRELGFQLRSAT